jgi:endo-1,4-beta-xylanase
MQIRGHNLVWAPDQWTPDWLVKNESAITPDKAKQLLSDYIHAVVSRYRGKILCWDVVNEAIDNNNNTNPLNLRNGFWFRKLGPDYIKYAFMFAHEADPDVKLYYNEYNIESTGQKATRTLNLINWLRSQGAIVHGVGLQWHIGVDVKITPGDGHYQSAQQFIDNKLDIMVTELDVAIPTNGSRPINPQDLQTQGDVYRSMLDYALHFSPNCKAMLTWGFTDRYSWIPSFSHNTRGLALPLDSSYMPKPAYWQMLDVMTHVVEDGVYRLSPQSEPNKCLGISQNMTSSDVQLYSGDCNNAYQKWNITWLGDGTYRFSSESDNNRVLGAYNTTASVGGVQTYPWSGDVNQEWAFSAQGNDVFRVVIRTAWWRVMTVYGTSDNIGIVDPSSTGSQNWILTKV